MRESALLRAALAAALLLLAPAVLRAQDLPPLAELLKGAASRADTLAIEKAYRATVSLRGGNEGAAAEPEVGVPEGEEPAGGRPARPDREATIPEADDLYRALLGQADTLAGEGPIAYRGERLVFYPESEIIVLEGQAGAGQAGTELSADRILYRSRQGTVEAFEEAVVSRGEQRLAADSLYYDRESGTVATFGVTTIQESQSETEGADVVYDLERRSGRIGGGRTIYEPWFLEASEMNKIGASTFVLAHGYFTTCDLDEPHYTFRADEIKLRRDDVIVARPVVLYFSDVPVFYLPWYVEPVTRGRSSGFLRPRIGLNTIVFGSGQERNVQDLGFYYVFNDFADAMVAADWYTESRFIARADVRYHVKHSFQGGAHVEQVWNRLDDSSQRLIRMEHDHTFGSRSRANLDVNWSNSRAFLRRNSFDPDEILQRSFRSAGNYSRRFDWGSFVAGADADFRLDVNRTDFRLPDLRLSINQRPLWGRAASGADAASAAWYRRLQYSANASITSRLSRAEVDSLGNPLTSLPTDSLGRPIEGRRETVVDEQAARTSLTLNGPLELFGVINANPSLSYSLDLDNDRLAEDEAFGGTGRLNAGLSLSSKFFRIFQSVPGPWFTALRHTVTPSVAFSYAPQPSRFGSEDTPGRAGGSDALFASFSLGQDFEVKMPVREDDADDGPDAAADSAAADSAAEEPEAGEAGEEPALREAPTRTVTLLSVVNSMGFDIERHREDGLLGFGPLSTRLTSGLGQDFNISMTMDHDLVEPAEGEDGEERFSPFLSRITTDFAIRQGGRLGSQRRRGAGEDTDEAMAGRGADDETRDAQENLAAGGGPGTEGFGPWSLSLTHSWQRSRDGEFDRQSLGVGLQMLPSPSWALNYQTHYDITEGNLQGQTLSLVRDLHDWQATLNVNLFPSEPQDRVLISFAVYLRDVPEFEVPYRVRRE